MRIGTVSSLPDGYSRYARIHDDNGSSYTVDPAELPKNASVGDEVAYKLDLWANDSGLAYGVKRA